MRTFVDGNGRHWDVAVMQESYGMHRLLFAVRGGDEMRAHELEVEGRFDAEQLLLRLGEEDLRALLQGAPEWRPG